MTHLIDPDGGAPSKFLCTTAATFVLGPALGPLAGLAEHPAYVEWAAARRVPILADVEAGQGPLAGLAAHSILRKLTS